MFTVGAQIFARGFVPKVVNCIDCSANAGNPIILCNVGLGQPQPVSSLEFDIPKICKEPLISIGVTFTANIFQFKKPVGIGNNVLKESIPKPGADLQGIITTLDKADQITCGKSEVSGTGAGYTDKCIVGVVLIVSIVEEDEGISVFQCPFDILRNRIKKVPNSMLVIIRFGI